MPSIHLSESISAAADRVFAISSDIKNTPAIFPQIVRIEMLAGGDSPRVGTRWRETRKAMGKEATVELEITAFDPPRSMTVSCNVMGARYDTVLSFRQEGAGTRVLMDTTITPTSLMGRLLCGLTKGAMAKGLREDLDSLKRAAESPPVNPIRP